MATRLMVAPLLMVAVFAIHFSESVDYDDVDDATPIEVLSEPFWIDAPDGTNGLKLWPNRTAIPYVITASLPEEVQRVIKRALRKMERTTDACVQFKQRTDEQNYLYFMNATSSKPSAGMQGGIQILSFVWTPGYSEPRAFGYVMHQTMNALGFQYEHQRRDRNDYIDIKYDQIKSGDEDEFETVRDIPTFGTKYDYHSIMHDGAFEHSKSKRPVIVPKKGLIIQSGQYLRLSPGDIAKIKRAYKCPMRISNQDIGLPQTAEPFPKFSLEPMSYEKCSLQYNDHCSPIKPISDVCGVDSFRKDFQIRCSANTNATVLEQMSLDMQNELRPVSIFLDISNRSIYTQYTFAPIRRKVLLVNLFLCASERTTGWLRQTKFSNLLEFQLLGCNDLAIVPEDFAYSRKLRIIVFSESTIKALGRGTFNNLPDLRILSLEALWNTSDSASEYGRFDQRMQTYLYKIHCSCEFAWFRSWRTNSKHLKIRADLSELYSIPGSYGNSAYKKEDLYHPIDCAASPFPAGIEWINYYTQVKYSINEPKCAQINSCHNLLHALATDCFCSTLKARLSNFNGTFD